MRENGPGYWAVIPAEVRYDDALPANAKLLYGEISSLCDQKGYCYASVASWVDVSGGPAPLTVAAVERVFYFASWSNALRISLFISVCFGLPSRASNISLSV